MSFFPDPQRQGDIKFIFAKKLPYLTRMQLIAGLFVAGIIVQLFLNFAFGLVLLAIATGLSLIRGYADKPEVVSAEEWNQVTPDEYAKVKLKQKQLKKWDSDCFDITNPLGSGIFIVVTVFCFMVWYMLIFNNKLQLATYWAWDAIVVFAPHWITGVRNFLTKDKLIIKINLLEEIMQRLAAPSDIQVLPMLSTQQTKEKGRVPVDARVMIRFVNAPDYFLGMQIQISINSVQGHAYPYLYCVLIAKEEAKLFEKRSDATVNVHKGILCEQTKSEGVDVLVMRQRTTKTSGYHTNLSASTLIVDAALEVARRLTKEAQKV
ncbi:hypothetical protein ACFL1E_00255 [Candidatus Omnitrophota bacterium]